MKSIWLENLDLSESETKVANALIAIKMPQNVTHIAKIADLPRTTTLYILHKFKKRKIAKRIHSPTSDRRHHWMKNIVILK